IVVPEGFTYELRSGSGGDPAASDPEGSGLYGHYRGAERGRYVDVYAEGFGPGAGASDVELLSERILGRRGGAFTRIHERFAVTFRAAGCGYSLQAYGVTERDLKELATNLAFTQKGARGRLDAFAVWPEVQVQDAVEACRAAVGGFDQGWRLDRRAVAAEFVDETLGWSEPSIERSTVGYAVAESLDELPTVGVVVSDPVAPGCYSVTSVGGTSEGSPGLLSFSSGQGSFEFMAYGPGLDYFEVEVPVTRIEATITFGSRAPVTRTFEAPFRKRSEVPLGSDISTSGAYLIVFKGPAGEVMGASGGALPPYDTAAG
ncbi:MAG TPA: hypothetical protein VFS18_04505, partial [Actinomycetota bacterium]|nr:hypothetical protein [Actinomycetota bacterium]